LELKRQGETLSGAQEAFQLWCVKHGIPYSVCHTFDQALAVFDGWGALRIKVGGDR
jgi:hypothetical protein